MRRRILACALATVLVASVAVRAGAETNVNELDLKTRAQRLQTSLNVLATEVGAADETLEEAKRGIQIHQRELDHANKLLSPLRANLRQRAAQLYILGSSGLLETILTTTDLETFLDRYTYLEIVSSGERGLLEELSALRRRATLESKLLGRSLRDAATAQHQLSAQRAQLDSSLSELKTLLGLLHGDVRRGPGGFLCPVDGPHALSNDYSAPRHGGPHTGVDLPADIGTPLVAVLGGVIVDTPTGGWWGNGIVLQDLAGNEYWYAHLSVREVEPGDGVQGGQEIGRVGNTGNSTGPHLHFEYHPGGGGPEDPYNLLDQVC